MNDVSRVTAALGAMGTVEREVFATPRQEWPFRVGGRVAVRVDGPMTDGLRPQELADPLVRTAVKPSSETVTAASDAAVVVVGKLASADALKARGYFITDGSPVTLKVWRGAGGEFPGHRERRIRRALEETGGFPMTPMLRDGRIHDADFVLEPVIYGRHPFSAHARIDAALELTPVLARAWQQWGPVDQPLADVFSRHTVRQLGRLFADRSLPWQPGWGSRAGLLFSLWRLVQRNGNLPCAPCHGDLVATNIIQERTGRHVIVDWEHGQQMPVAFDLAKLLLTSGRPEEINCRMSEHLLPFGQGRSRYAWNEQVALGLARVLSWSRNRRLRASTAGRVQQFDDEQMAQIEFLVSVLGDGR